VHGDEKERGVQSFAIKVGLKRGCGSATTFGAGTSQIIGGKKKYGAQKKKGPWGQYCKKVSETNHCADFPKQSWATKKKKKERVRKECGGSYGNVPQPRWGRQTQPLV